MSAPSSVHTHNLGPVDQIPFGEGRAFGVDGEQVAVFRVRDGSLRALSATTGAEPLTAYGVQTDPARNIILQCRDAARSSSA